MWIKWKYNDHGWPDFKELEISDDELMEHETVEEWLCEKGMVPVWSERFMRGRIKWEKLNLSPAEIKRREIAKLKSSIACHQTELAAAEAKLKELEAKFQVGDMVYATDNPVWGLAPMKVVSVGDLISCQHPTNYQGAFGESELELVTDERARQVQRVIDAQDNVKAIKKEVFGKRWTQHE